MDISSHTISRKQHRFKVNMQVLVSGIDKDGHYFSAPAETLNGSSEGMGLLLNQDLYPYTALVISIPREQPVLQLQTDVRHVTPHDSGRNLVGVRFRKTAVV